MKPAGTSTRAALSEYYRRIAAGRLAPLWERLAELLPAEPRVRARPHLWDYEALRPMLLESADLIGEQEAERRVLILENPGLEGESAITDALFAGLQLMMPGEHAPPHRHTPAALRFILESEAAYTTVDDEQIDMRPGDLILTPAWTWHGHGHEGSKPVVWLDVLDLPAVRALGPRFAERRGEASSEPLRRNDSLQRYGMNMAPVGARGATPNSPLSYPYARSRDVLERLKARTDLDSACGLKMEYIDPAAGGSVLPTISAFLQLLPAGFAGDPYQTTEGIIYCVVEGRGRVSIGTGPHAVSFDYKPNDIFAVPCWHAHAFTAVAETVLFSASDRAAQSRLGLWRERDRSSSAA